MIGRAASFVPFSLVVVAVVLVVVVAAVVGVAGAALTIDMAEAKRYH